EDEAGHRRGQYRNGRDTEADHYRVAEACPEIGEPEDSLIRFGCPIAREKGRRLHYLFEGLERGENAPDQRCYRDEGRKDEHGMHQHLVFLHMWCAPPREV